MGEIMVRVYAPIARPTIGSVGKTGIWRSVKPVVNYDKCINCYLCWMYCPEGCIDIIDDMVRIDYDYCKGCGICSNVCPVKAIEMVREE